ncbi:hypothetical protein NC653_024646 [Populus alba x Populus x berolinensis]|uniref:Uncharacterized protein n=1 Tax=Populus alba x Populus x berolinensis TaxID=444605 RepID=A0AAD6M988_9ROSI|nr:hypothetical protein NC653_024646 [Populus alba x Populus x berolinensis]
MKIDPEGYEKDLVWFTANSSRLWSFFNSKHLSISPQPFPSISVTAPRFWLMLHPFTRSNSLSFSNRLLGLCLQELPTEQFYKVLLGMFDSSSRLKMMMVMLQVAKTIQILKLLKLSLMKSMYKSSPLQIYSLGLHLPLYVSRVLFPATVLLYQVPPDADEPLFKQIANQFVSVFACSRSFLLNKRKKREQNRSGGRKHGNDQNHVLARHVDHHSS